MRELQVYEYDVVNGAAIDFAGIGSSIGVAADKFFDFFNIITNFSKGGKLVGEGLTSIFTGDIFAGASVLFEGVKSIGVHIVIVISEIGRMLGIGGSAVG